jgi:hypothetical protein
MSSHARKDSSAAWAQMKPCSAALGAEAPCHGRVIAIVTASRSRRWGASHLDPGSARNPSGSSDGWGDPWPSLVLLLVSSA